MVPVTKDEKFAILERFPKTNIVRTMRQRSKRHHYYCEEAPQVMRYLSTLRGKEDRHAVRSSGRRV